MDELVKLVSQKTGIPENSARQAVDTVLEYIKERLPDPIAGQVEALLAGGGLPDDLGDLGDIAKGLGGLLGK